jgi:transaldolase
VPEETLLAFFDHGEVDRPMARDGDDAEQVLVDFSRAGIDVAALAKQLQEEGAKSFVDSWHDLLGAIESKSKALS